MINQSIHAELPEDAVIFESPAYDNSIIGISTDGVVVYDYNSMVKEFYDDCAASGTEITEMDAEDFVSYNTVRALTYFTEPNKPVIVCPLDECL